MKVNFDQETKDAWVRALRSGEYVQAFSALALIDPYEEGVRRKVVGHCCLGVLMSVVEGTDDPLHYPATAGLMDADAQTRFMELNDRLHWSFGEIADLVEAEVESS